MIGFLKSFDENNIGAFVGMAVGKAALIAALLGTAGCTAENPLFNADAVGAADLRDSSDMRGRLNDSFVGLPDLAVAGPCGAVNQVCCGGNTCNGGACCAVGVCVGAGHQCSGTAICQSGTCATCGAPGLPCCENATCANGGCCTANRICATNGGTCGDGCVNGSCGMCQNGSCVGMMGACGEAGGPCCTTPDPQPNFCVAAGTVCAPGMMRGPGQCLQCGGPAQPCCDNNTCAQGGCCVGGVCVAGGQTCGQTLCSGGSCGGGKCGGPGQPCCGSGANSVCTAPDTICNMGNCVACGGQNQSCCIDWSLQTPLHCTAPFQISGVTIQMGRFMGQCICK